MHRPPEEVWNSSQFAGTSKRTVACCVWPFQAAVTVTFWGPLTVPELAGNVALFWPAGTVTLAGMVSNALLLASEIVSTLAAGLLKVTVQVLDTLLPRVAGVHTRDVSCFESGGVVVSVKVWEIPSNVAVSTAD